MTSKQHEYQVAIDAANEHARKMGADPDQVGANVADLMFDLALHGDEQALRCLLAETSAAAAVEATRED